MKMGKEQIMLNKMMGIDDATFEKFGPKEVPSTPQIPKTEEYIAAFKHTRKLLGLPE